MSELHVPELTLRRIFAGELKDPSGEAARKHANECGACKAKLRVIEEEQQKFEKQISFDRFKAGVERASRGKTGAPSTVVGFVMAAAAAILVVFVVPALIAFNGFRDSDLPTRFNNTKGAEAVDMYIAPADNGPQRTASSTTPELLSSGDRVRLAYKANGYHYVTVVSVDEAGEVTPMYPERGLTPKVSDPFAQTLLPGAWEFTGKGAETIVILFTDGPLEMNDVLIATKDAWERSGGKVSELPEVYIPGLQIGQIHRTVLKQ